MNKTNRNSNMQKLDRNSRFPLNSVKFGEGESRTHAIKKFNYILNFKGNSDFLTECYDKGRKHRADIIFMTEPRFTVVEIKVSESDESLRAKKAFWENIGFRMIIF